ITLNGTFTDTPSNNGTPTYNWHLVSSSNGQTIDDGSGQSLSFSPSGTGTYTFRFTVTDAAGNAGSDTVDVVVDLAPSTTALSPSVSTITYGQSVTFTATVTGSGSPTGTVTFMEGATTLGTGTLSLGTATFSTTALAAGTHTITAVYGGD